MSGRHFATKYGFCFLVSFMLYETNNKNKQGNYILSLLELQLLFTSILTTYL